MNLEDTADFHYWRASALFRERRNTEALGHLDAALSAVPEHVAALLLCGELYLLRASEVGVSEEEGDREALAAFDRVLQLDSRNPDAWADRGLALLYRGRSSEALECAERGLRELLNESLGHGLSDPRVRDNVEEALLNLKI